ncbi:GntR family transcriptional regulator [uncultured Sulfitobacter sp.]|uniref:GntR family transcriptional regulator n=1 Tax=uncultured Sulfitobacter sp. TaxID=191468 RepID=UPI002623FBDA|nr:GntR family transcriptional regulator [uncultured Sulfitobacter sp.]
MNKKTLCVEDLRKRILSQDIAPGSDLDEVSLSQRYGISRTPLREILHRLAGDGYVRLEENRGAKVVSMDLSVMRVFFQTAPLVYSSVARQAAENRTGRQLEDLKETQAAFTIAAKARETEQAALLNHRFHEIIGEMAQNPYLFASLKRMLIDHTRLSQTFFRPHSEADVGRVSKAIDQHDAMISAIEAREPSLAIDLTLQHWDLSRDQIENYVRPDPLPLDVISMKDHKNAV